MNDAAWLSLTIALTVVAGLWTWHAARRRGAASAVRGAALTLLPTAAYLTGTLELGMRVVDAVADWAAGFVFRPTVWIGIAVAGLAVLLFLLSGFLRGRSTGTPDPAPSTAGSRRSVVANKAKGAPAIDDDLGDIEAILKKHGIS